MDLEAACKALLFVCVNDDLSCRSGAVDGDTCSWKTGEMTEATHVSLQVQEDSDEHGTFGTGAVGVLDQNVPKVESLHVAVYVSIGGYFGATSRVAVHSSGSVSQREFDNPLTLFVQRARK